MPQKTNLNVAPYYDDFDQDKNFYKVLFRPGYSIQARELTQLQSILQNQIEQFGKYSFKQGELVIPGEVGLNTKLSYVKLSSVSEIPVNQDGKVVYKKYDIKALKGHKLKGLTSGVIATVVSTKDITDISSDVVYVNYTNSGDAGNEETFRQGETLEVVDGVNTPLLVVGTDGSVLPTSISITDPDTGISASLESTAMGYASAVQVEEGIYFVNGYFVKNKSQLLVIDDYYDKPSAKVGFKIDESLITPEEDTTLYDNAIGSSNFSSPGSHRLKIELTIVKYDLSEITDKNFIQLLTVKRGAVQSQVVQTDYSLLEQTLARRTFDESGDYVVDNFSLDVREYYQKGGNLGVYPLDEFGQVNGFTTTEAEDKLLASVGPGKAYIKGYEIVNKETKYLPISKARETLNREDIRLKTTGLPTYKITNTYNTIPLNAEGSELSAYPNIFLSSLFNDGSIGLNNSEAATDSKQTTNRRGTFFDTNSGVRTIYIEIHPDSVTKYNALSDANWLSDYAGGGLSEIAIISSRVGTTTTPNAYKDITPIAFSKVNRKEWNSSTSAFVLELTVTANKDILDQYLLEYDAGDASGQREIYWKHEDAMAQGEATPPVPLGHIIDYNETFTPVIGTVKPSNITLTEKGTGFNPDTDIVLSKGRQSNGDAIYNTIFGMSYFDPQFFTKIILDSPLNYEGKDEKYFAPGRYVYGIESGAYGVVEGESLGKYTSTRTLMVKTLFGQFKSGETIRDENNNILKIAKDNTISHFIVNNRGGDYSTGSFLRIDGVDYDDSKITLPIEAVGGKITSATIKDRQGVNIEYSKPPVIVVVQSPSSSVTPNAAVITPVLVRNAVTTYTPQNVKSFFSKFGSGSVNTFTSDVELTKEKYSEVKSVTDSTFSGEQGRKYLECNGFGGDSTKVLQQGDLIQFTDSTDTILRCIVQYATKPEGVLKSRIYLDRSLPAPVSNSSVVRVRPSIDNFNQGTLLYKTGTNQVSSIVADSEDSKISYFLRRDFVSNGSGGAGMITFAAQLPFGTQRFVSFDESNFLVTILNSGDAPNISKGDVIYLTSDQVSITSSVDSASGLTAGSVALSFSEGYFGTIPTGGTYPTLKLTATLEVSKAKPRLKTAIVNKRIVIDSVGDNIVPFRGKDYDGDSLIVYSYADAYKLRYVYEGTTSTPPTVDRNGNLLSGTDVTNRFTFDDGQRDTIYDLSRIVLKPGADTPTGQLVICFDYFEHTQGDFCCVDSYLHEAGVGPEDIPSFNSPALGKVSLSDVLDFRPKVDNDSITSGFQNNSLLSSSNTRSFTGTGGIVSSTPASDSNLEYTFTFTQKQYLDRIDGLFLNKKGEFIIKEGNSSLNPSKPDPLNDAISLYYMYVPAFTESNKDIRIVPVDNKRYTMRDIGKLEKRIERLEYYTTLSVLEQQALNMHVTDSTGINRFKSGFIVDNFETHKIGSLKSVDYKCSIDTQQSVLRPQSREDSFTLEEVNTRDDQRSVSGYKRSGDAITLPYTELELLGNSFGTKTINPNPFVVLQYVGDSFIAPSSDSWYDTSVAPLVTDNNTNLYSIFLAKNELKDAFSSLYNSYKINWIGADRAFFNIGSFAETNSNISDTSVTSASVGSSSNISPQNNEIGKGITTRGVGSNVVATSLSFFARSIPVHYSISRLKPNTNISVFMEGQDISRWVNPDYRYTGVAGNSLSSFNTPVTTDENGNASGIILIPAGQPPRENTTWTGNVDTVSYDTDASEIRFTTGAKTIRFTSSSTNANKNEVETYAEIKYYATGIIPENPSSIVSTSPAFFKSNEGTQIVDSNTDNPSRPNPLAQTFTVDGFDGGLFATSVDLFFAEKSSNIPIRVYLTDVDNGKPGKNIIPGTQKVLNPDTYLRVVVSDTLTITKGEKVTGVSSNASGPVSRVFDKNNIEVTASATGLFTLTNDQVYTLLLNNYNGIDFKQDENLSVPSIITANNTNNTTLLLKIVKDSGRVTDLKIKNTGYDYDSAIVTIESPQLPGGGNATATVRVSGNKVYHTELVLAGSEYTEPPSVVIRGTGTGNAGAEIESFITIDSPAVRMGIAIDEVGVTNSTTPTKFTFDYPVYLQNETEYSLVVETDSIDYQIWASALGESDIATSTTVTTQPSLGSLFKSQNTNAWTEDLFEDIKYKIHRAEFDITRPAELLLTNEDLGYEQLSTHPIETDATANSTATSSLFKNNNFNVKVNHSDNGFDPDGKSYVFFKGASDVGGVTAIQLNSELFKVNNTGVDYYTITSSSRASSTSTGGGTVLASYNRKFEKLHAIVPNLSFTQTKVDSSVKTTNVSPIDDNVGTFTSYSQTNYEKTFLNEDFFFINQKILSSRINEISNNISRSLEYKIDISSTVSHLSPLIDLSRASVKTITNRVENPKGNEDRFGRRDQLLEFYPVYSFQTNGVDVANGESITVGTRGQKLEGATSGAVGDIVKVDGTIVYVKVKTNDTFVPGETLTFATDTFAGTVTVDSSANVTIVPFDIPDVLSPPSYVTARNPGTPTDTYDNKISGRVLLWNEQSRVLTVTNDKQPINNDYTATINSSANYTRNAVVDSQDNDIFRVGGTSALGDIISYTDQDADEQLFIEVSKVSYTDGIEYTSDIQSKGSSSIAKYITKEVAIQNPATSIDLKITANTSEIENISILYRTKKSSSQENFEDIEWIHFNGTGLPDVDVIATAENSISGITEKQSSYQELSYSVEDLPEFSSFAIKVVMKSSNPAFVPKIQDLRAVASY